MCIQTAFAIASPLTDIRSGLNRQHFIEDVHVKSLFLAGRCSKQALFQASAVLVQNPVCKNPRMSVSPALLGASLVALVPKLPVVVRACPVLAAAALAVSVLPPRSGTAPITSCLTLAPNLLLSPLVALLPMATRSPAACSFSSWQGRHQGAGPSCHFLLACALTNAGSPVAIHMGHPHADGVLHNLLLAFK